MGCVSSTYLNHEDEFSQFGRPGLGHHIVSLTSTSYGLLNLDPPQQQPPPLPPPLLPTPRSNDVLQQPPTETPPRFILGTVFVPSSVPEPMSLRSQPSEIINSWELMAGLDTESFRFSTTPTSTPTPTNPFLAPSKPSQPSSQLHTVISRPAKPFAFKHHHLMSSSSSSSSDKENTNPNRPLISGDYPDPSDVLKPLNDSVAASNVLKPLDNSVVAEKPFSCKYHSLEDEFEKRCPPNGESKLVLYTTTLRGVRKTFEDCNAVRAVLEGIGVSINERDISMDRGFREELRELMIGKDIAEIVPPRVFVKGRYIGGASEVLRIHEDGRLVELLEGLPKAAKFGAPCDGCGGVRFLPCFRCNGSCKLVMLVKEQRPQGSQVLVRCPDCNENGLILCPICS